MPTQSQFHVLDTPRKRSLKSLGKRELTTLLAGGIINPFGPTLTALALEGIMEPGIKLPILYLMLNPFTQEVSEVGFATLGESWNPLEDIPRFFELSFGSCPTLLLPLSSLEREASIALYARFLSTFEDGHCVLEKVRAFPGDPWNRVKQDMGGIAAVLERIHLGKSEDDGWRALTTEESRELASHLLNPQNVRAELQAFLFAWNGSIEFQGGGSMGKRAMSLDTFAEHLARLALSCDMPPMGRN